jgi:hypothetical protein
MMSLMVHPNSDMSFKDLPCDPSDSHLSFILVFIWETPLNPQLSLKCSIIEVAHAANEDINKSYFGESFLACYYLLIMMITAGQKFTGHEGNIPDLPHIVVCPVNLKDQWQHEMERFLNPFSFDILLYVGKVES